MSYEAIVVLKALSSDILPSERILFLDPGTPSISVGRASKSLSKGLVADVDNAWFDSPVMSREHALISFDPDNLTVNIEDTSSMHGTTIDDSTIPPGERRTLTSGDTLTFGAEVRRGIDTFEPCKFNVELEFRFVGSDRHGSSTFKVPYSSDVDEQDDEDYYGVEDEQSEEEEGEQAETKPFQEVRVIDLTQDEVIRTTQITSVGLQDVSQDNEIFEGGLVWAENADHEKNTIRETADEEEGGDEQDEADDEDSAHGNEEVTVVELEVEGDINVAIISDDDDEDVFAIQDVEEIPSGQGNITQFGNFLDSQDPVDLTTNDSLPLDQEIPTSHQPSSQMDNFVSEAMESHVVSGMTDEVIEGEAGRNAAVNFKDGDAVCATDEDEPAAPLRGNIDKAAVFTVVEEDAMIDSPANQSSWRTDKPVFEHTLTSMDHSPDILDVCNTTKPTLPTKRFGDDDLDMTSAVSFARSKAMQGHDLPPRQNGIKRKAENIADLLSVEETRWDASYSPSRKATRKMKGKNSPVKVVAEPQTPSDINSQNANHSSDGRSTKRIKRFAEAVGYAALGGVAVGAGLFSLLVATAPELA